MIPAFRAKSPIFVFLVALILASLACQVLGAVTPTPETELPPPRDEGDPILQDTPTAIPSTAIPPTKLPATLPPTDPPEPTPIPIGAVDPLNIGPFQARFVGPLPGPRVTALFPAQNEFIWLQTSDGAYRLDLDLGDLQTVETPGDLVALDQAGALWAWDPDMGQLSSFSGTADWLPEINLTDLGLSPPEIEDIFASYIFLPTRTGALFVGQCQWIGPGPLLDQGGLRWIEDGRISGLEFPADTGCVTGLAEDAQGRIWVGVNDSLWNFDPGSDTWTLFDPPTPPEGATRFGFFTLLQPAPDGSVYAALSPCGGASCFGGEILFQFIAEQWIQVGEVGDYPEGYLYFQPGVGTWMLQRDALFQIQDNEVSFISIFEGTVIGRDPMGRVWIAGEMESGAGLWVLDPQAAVGD